MPSPSFHPLLRLLSLSVLVLLAAAGCGEGSAEQDASPAEAFDPGAHREEFRFVTAQEHNFLDPQKMSWLHDIRIAECMYETLARSRVPELTLEAGAAERWDVSDDKLTYTFHIRPEARWSNGDPVTAHDFVFAWQRMMMPDFAADYSQLFFCIDGAEEFFKWRGEQLAEYAADRDAQGLSRALELVSAANAGFGGTVGVRAADDRTLVVRLRNPTPYFLDLAAFISFAPLHRASVEESTRVNPETGRVETDANYWATPGRVVTNGPYVLERRRFKQDLRLVQNPHYWNREAMGNRAILELIIDDPQAQFMAYTHGRADWLPDFPSAAPMAADLVAQGREDIITTPWVGTYFYNFNCLPTLPDGRRNPLADPRVRRALSMGIDRQTIVRQVTRMNQPIARTFIPPDSIEGYSAPVDAGVTFNPEEAKRLLADAGYPGGQGLGGLSILYNTGAGHEYAAQQIKRSWQDHLGVNVQLEGLETLSFKDRLKSHNFTISRASWIGDYPDPTTFLDKLVSDNGNNDGAYNNPRYDALIRQAAAELDEAKRMAILREAEALMLSEQPIAPIYHYITLHIYDPAKVEGIHPNVWNQRRLEFVRVRK